MELVYDKRLVHYLGKDEKDRDGNRWFDFAFRDGSGEKFNIELPQDEVPNTFFGCSKLAMERALQQILDQHSASPV